MSDNIAKLRFEPETVEASERVYERRIIISAVLLGVALAGCLIYTQAMLNYYHQHDTRPWAGEVAKMGETAYFQPWIEADAKKHLWAIGIPSDVEMILTLIPVTWICLMVFYYRWPRSLLYAIFLYLLIGFIFMAIMGGMDMGSFL